jgi:hypothetical protein
MSLHLAGKRIVASEDVLVRELHGESVLLDLKSESYFGLDEVGTRMWEALTAHDSVESAFDALLEAYDVPASELRDDLERFVDELAESGLVDVRNAAA